MVYTKRSGRFCSMAWIGGIRLLLTAVHFGAACMAHVSSAQASAALPMIR